MSEILRQHLSSKNGIVRKGAASALLIPQWFARRGASEQQYQMAPSVLVNSIPKSGTHLLVQIVAGLPNSVNYGQFLASMTSSFRFRERSADSVRRFILGIAPGEIVRAHLFFSASASEALSGKNVVRYFLYRDPRDVALSGAHYVRSMNRWHKLHRHFGAVNSIDEAISLAIRGLPADTPGVDFPNVERRYRRYLGWLADEDCLAIRYESLQSTSRGDVVREVAEFYAARTSSPLDIDATVDAMLAGIAPAKSHTFRQGEKSGWRRSFTREHRELFHEIAGDLLIELGYENDSSWVDIPESTQK